MVITNKKPYLVYLDDFNEIYELEDQHFGLCLACGNDQYNCEPDASDYVCESCGQPKVQGAMNLALSGRFAASSVLPIDQEESQNV